MMSKVANALKDSILDRIPVPYPYYSFSMRCLKLTSKRYWSLSRPFHYVRQQVQADYGGRIGLVDPPFMSPESPTWLSSGNGLGLMMDPYKIWLAIGTFSSWASIVFAT